MDAGPLGVADGIVAGVDGLGVGMGKPSDDGTLDFFGDPGHGLEVSRGAEGESRFDNVDAQLVELMGDFHLFVDVQGGAGCLFPVPEGRIKYHYFFHREPPG